MILSIWKSIEPNLSCRVFRLVFLSKNSKSRWPGEGNPAECFPLHSSRGNSSMNLPFCSSWWGVLENMHKTKHRSLYFSSCRLIGCSGASWDLLRGGCVSVNYFSSPLYAFGVLVIRKLPKLLTLGKSMCFVSRLQWSEYSKSKKRLYTHKRGFRISSTHEKITPNLGLLGKCIPYAEGWGTPQILPHPDDEQDMRNFSILVSASLPATRF